MSRTGRERSRSFEWGYNGSGPSALAHSILLDACGGDVADDLYQLFKQEVVATWKRDRWEISADEIRKWAAAKMEGAR